jgi:protein TonB
MVESIHNEPGVLSPDRRIVTSVRKGTRDGTIVLVVNFMLINSQPGLVQTPFGAVVPTQIATPFGTQATGDVTNVKTLTPISTVDPVYPPLARQARIQGVVVLQVTVNPQGAVETWRVVTGHPLLVQAAVDAVKQWRYEPQADTVTTVATINFAF